MKNSFVVFLLAILLFAFVSVGFSVDDKINSQPVVAFDFEEFDGELPKGWTFDSWNQEYVKERFGKSTPGREGKGSCLELKQGNPIAALTISSNKIQVMPDCKYVFKGYYSSTCSRIEVVGQWLDENDAEVGKFEFILPSTQDGWIEFFDEVVSPSKSKKIYLQILLKRKHQHGRVRFDDFTLRKGTIRDYMSEFSLPPEKSDTAAFPILGWMGPGVWPNFAANGAQWVHEFDKDKYHAEYALCGFNLNVQSKFGTRSFPWAPQMDKDEDFIAMGKNPDVWTIHGGDEPLDNKFPQLAKLNEKIKKLAPSKSLWINLLPNYAFKSQDDYRKHIQNYIAEVKPDMLTYDHYTLSGGRGHYGRDYFANLEIVRDETLKNNVKFGVVLSVTGFMAIRPANEAELRWQAYTTLAYGSKYLGWFTYLTEIEYGGHNWSDAPIDRKGNRGRHYAMLKRVNYEILNLGPILSKLNSTGVFHTKPIPKVGNIISKDVKCSKLIKNIDSGQWVIGEFKDPKGQVYMMLVNRDFTKTQKAKITFKPGIKAICEIEKVNGKKREINEFDKRTHSMTVDMPAGDGRLYLMSYK